MAIAGKVAITLSTENGGAWSADVTYDRLVAVKHNNNLYISRKTVANVEPPNDEFWFLALEGFGGDDVQALIERLNELSDLIQAIINGTTQVGNAKTLDGHGAEDFLPKSGGTINGNVFLTSLLNELRVFVVNNSLRQVNVEVQQGGVFRLRDTTNSKDIINSSADGTNTFNGTASGNLPLNGGGTVSAEGAFPLSLKTNSGGTVLTKHINAHGVVLGNLGFSGIDNPIVKTSDGNTNYTLLHTGNKPTGTYTGNGDATERVIDVGGIGDTLRIKGTNGYSVLVDYNGAWGVKSDGTAVSLGRTDCYFASGQLVLKTTSSIVNNNTSTFTWRLL